MNIRKTLSVATGVLSVLTFLCAPLTASAQTSPGADKTIRQAFRTGCMAGPLYTTCGNRLDETVLQGLAHVNWKGDGVKALLAESWSTPDKGKTWIFKLRKGVKWHDGKPFTADDVVFSYNTYADPAVASIIANNLSDVKGYSDFRSGKASSLAGVSKVDNATVKIELNGPRPLWVELKQIYFSILPKHLLGEVKPTELSRSSYWAQNRIGTGPFKWSKYVPDQYVELVRNDDYFLGKPKADRIIYRIFADIPSILNALAANEVPSANSSACRKSQRSMFCPMLMPGSRAICNSTSRKFS